MIRRPIIIQILKNAELMPIKTGNSFENTVIQYIISIH